MLGGEPALLCWREGEGAQPEEALPHIRETPTASPPIGDVPMGIERGARGRTASRERTVYRMAHSATVLPSPVGGQW